MRYNRGSSSYISKKMVNSAPNKVVIYLRVSKEIQERSGLGIEGQRRLCHDVCKRLNLQIEQEFEECISGKTTFQSRPIFMEALELAQKTGARLMVAKVDRFSRKLGELINYVDKSIFGNFTPDLLVAETPEMSLFELRLRAVIAQEEREAISKRTKAALAERKSQGMVFGREGREAHSKKAYEKTKDAMDLAVKLRSEGMGYQYIADKLNQQGFTTSKGGKWYAASIRKRLITLESSK